MADNIELNMFFNKHKKTLEILLDFLDKHPTALEEMYNSILKIHKNEMEEGPVYYKSYGEG